MEFMSAGSLYDIVKLYPNGVKAREEDCAYVVREVPPFSPLRSLSRVLVGSNSQYGRV